MKQTAERGSFAWPFLALCFVLLFGAPPPAAFAPTIPLNMRFERAQFFLQRTGYDSD